MKLGNQTFSIDKDVFISDTFTLCGPLEQEGALKEFFHMHLKDDELDCSSHEKAEVKMQKIAISELMRRNNIKPQDVDCLIGGDLLNQLVPTNFSAREFYTAILGVYSACASFGESLCIGANMIASGNCERLICTTSSHFSTAERQYRYPLELGTQPTPSSQWTVTACGSALLTAQGGENTPKITNITLGRVVDLLCTDANNMGAAMAPAACDTIIKHLKATNRDEKYYDLIITGDLGRFGRETLYYLCKEEGYDLDCCLNDCGALIYNKDQKVMQGGSGAGCSSGVFGSYLYSGLLNGDFKKILLVPTGALLSKDSSLQGESIPAIAHAVAIEVN